MTDETKNDDTSIDEQKKEPAVLASGPVEDETTTERPRHVGHAYLDEIETKANAMGSYVVSELQAPIAKLRAVL